MVAKRDKIQPGFTIIELMIALTFIAFLLMFIVATTLRVANLYSKGVTLKSMNQASRTVVEQMSRDIAESYNPVLYPGPTSGGIMCTDKAVYMWNRLTVSADPATNDIRYASPDTGRPIGLLRTNDLTMCESTGTKDDIPYSANGEYSELLSGSASVVAISLTQHQGNLYRLTVRLGTPDTDAYDTSGGDALGYRCMAGREGEFCQTVEFERLIYAP